MVCGVVAGAAGHLAVATSLLLAAPTLWMRGRDGDSAMARPVAWLSRSAAGTIGALIVAGLANTVSGPRARAWVPLAEVQADLAMAVFGLGQCAELLPELAALDEWGYPILHTAAVPTELRGHAGAAVRACPRLALRLAPPPSGGQARNRQSTRQAPKECRSR